MENKRTASLSNVDPASVTLKELVDFIDEISVVFPVAIRVLAKRLIGRPAMNHDSDYFQQQFNDEEIISSLRKLESEMQNIAQKEVAATVVLSLHSTFGFGRKRILRLWDQARDEIESKVMTVENLVRWCDARGIDYDEIFSSTSQKR